MSRIPAALLLTLLASSCATKIDVDPEGYRCDVGEVCPAGYSCVSGTCRAGPPVVAGGGNDAGSGCTSASGCITPPANTCKDASTLLAWSSAGTCDAAGKCAYASMDVACSQGCANGQCIGDLCAGVTCDLPPSPVCVDANTLRSHPMNGTCDDATGQCVFVPMDTTCPGGCAANMCQGSDLCAQVACNTPPPPECKGTQLVTYAAAGTCDPGTGKCSYSESATNCSGDCVSGACVPMSKTLSQIGPRVRSAVTALDLAPSSSGGHALVVGPGGYVAKWDGTGFTQLASNTTEDLTAVWFLSPNVAFIVGDGGVALRYDGTALTAITLPASAGVDLVSVHGFSDANATHVLIAARNGAAWRSTNGTTFLKAPAPPSSNTYAMTQAFVANDGSERISGLCTPITTLDKPCLLYASSVTSNSWFVDPQNSSLLSSSTPFGAVGPSVDSGFAFVSQGVTVYRHETASGDLDTTNVPTGLMGSGVRGFTRDSNNVNAVFITTTGTPGRLYRWIKGAAPTELLRMYFGAYAMSRNDSGGVLVADSGAALANIHRRGAVTNESLDLAESWVDVDVSASGRRVFINAYGDLASQDANSALFRFALSPYATMDHTGVVAADTYALVFGKGGKVSKFTPSGGYVVQSGSGSADLNAGCRSSDAEVYLVGASGKILSYNGATLTSMASPTTEALLAITCTGPGGAFAVGANGTVLKLSGGAWSKVSPLVGSSVTLSSVVATPNELYVAGNNALSVFSQGSWKTLPGKPALVHLLGANGNDLYGVVADEVFRFDGSSWTSVYTAPSDLIGAAMSGGKLLFVGQGGLVVEGK